MTETRLLPEASEALKTHMERLIEIETMRQGFVIETREIIDRARKIGYERKIIASLEGLTYHNDLSIKEMLDTKAAEYLRSRMYVEPVNAMPGM
jgi:hypothetical protein